MGLMASPKCTAMLGNNWNDSADIFTNLSGLMVWDWHLLKVLWMDNNCLEMCINLWTFLLQLRHPDTRSINIPVWMQIESCRFTRSLTTTAIVM